MTPINENFQKLAAAYNCREIYDFKLRQIELNHGENLCYPTTLNGLIFPTAGAGTIQLDQLIFSLRHGTCLNVCPGKQLTTNNSGEIPFRYTVIYYSGKSQPVFEIRLRDSSALYSILEQLLSRSGSIRIAKSYQQDVLIEQFFEHLFKDIQPSAISTDEDLLQSAMDYIHKNYDQQITLNSLAQQVGTSVSHLSYLFEKYLKIRPIDYLIDYRIKQAVRLLRQPESLPIAQIARQVGYADAGYFSRIFKKRMGFPPGKIRSR